MKKILVKNHATTDGQKITLAGNEFNVKPIVQHGDAEGCRINFVEVPPSQTAYGYHYHESNEELFYIISGRGNVRTQDGELTVNAGDAIFFPAGPEGTHVISNPSTTDKLVYIDFGTHHSPEVVHFPDARQVMVIGSEGPAFYKER